MPLDDGCVGRIAKLGDIDDLERSRGHQVAHQRIADRTAKDADDIDRHAKKRTDGTAAG